MSSPVEFSSPASHRFWTRREWVTRGAILVTAGPATRVSVTRLPYTDRQLPYFGVPHARRHDGRLDDAQLATWETLAQETAAAAMRAGAHYADVRLTRTLIHRLYFVGIDDWIEFLGLGVRVLVNGYWGFAAVPSGDATDAEQLARDAVAQATLYAHGSPRTVELGTIPRATGRWTMPVKIDPFVVPFEEKLAMMQSWVDYGKELGIGIDGASSELHCLRQDRVVATSEGSCFTQTVFESGGIVNVSVAGGRLPLDGFTPMGKGWELMLDANVPAQLRAVPERVREQQRAQANSKPAQVGRYTLVCDGATMASLVDRTFAIATQLDRAVGYEANASGTSFLSDPLNILGSFQVGSPAVTLTANRSAPGQLATVKWDTEGVIPDDFTLIHNGVLTDYQTTREQAAWLKPYYQKAGKPIRSHGCATADTALCTPLQQTPNLALVAAATNTTLADLVANVENGVLITHGEATADFQVQTGVLQGSMQEIKHGRVRAWLNGGAIIFNTLELWKNVTAVGGHATSMTVASSWYPYPPEFQRLMGSYPVKGQPPQRSSASIQAPAAMITSQAIVDLRRKV